MKLRLLIVLACTLLAVSACVVEPYGGGRGYYGDRGYYGGGYYGGDRGPHDYGRRVWRE
jgi:hypothetical protein